MPKLTTQQIENIQSALSVLNANFAAIEEAVNNTLSRSGTSPNQMVANLDMNGFRILNLSGITLEDFIPIGPWEIDEIPHNTDTSVQAAFSSTGAVIYSNRGATGPITFTLTSDAQEDLGIIFKRHEDFPVFIQLTAGSVVNTGPAGALVEILSHGYFELFCSEDDIWTAIPYGTLWSGS